MKNAAAAWQNAGGSLGCFSRYKLLFLLYDKCTIGYCFLRIRRLGVRIPLGAPFLHNLLIIHKLTEVTG